MSAIPEHDRFPGETDRLNLPPQSTQAEQALRVEPPAEREAGIKVETVEELVDKLKNEAKVIS